MDFVHFGQISAGDRYKLLCATVIPRPIALVTTVAPDGSVNAAPFSFFNVFSEEPALIVLGLQHRSDGSLKDTAGNIARTGRFVVHLVDEPLADAMNLCSIDFPPGESEIAAAGLTLRPGRDGPVPIIAEAPFAIECRRHASLVFGPGRELLVGEALALHARPGLVDAATFRVDGASYHPVGRLLGDGYARQRDRFEMPKESYAEWSARQASDSEPSADAA